MEGKKGDEQIPRVAVAVFVLKGSCVLLGKRLSVIGEGTFALPGGRLEFAETFEQCATREIKEETNLDITNVEILTVVNAISLDDRKPSHFVTIIARAALSDPNQTPTNVEPDKCDGWGWYEWIHLPDPLFLPLEKLVRSGFNPFSYPSQLVNINA